jgi:spoIIIJ-associated protein
MNEHIPHIETILTTLLDRMGFCDADIEHREYRGRYVWNVSLKAEGARLLAHSDTIRALAHVVQKIQEKHGIDGKCVLDVNGAQQAHIQEVEEKARLLADRVRTFHSRAEMVPMNAYERMIIHSLFSDDPDISTTSEGEGVGRHVVLQYAGARL